MSNVPQENVPPFPAVIEQPIADEKTGMPYISWGAIFAGLVIVLSLSWLLYLLGAAMGVSIADAMDSANMEGGLAIGATLWIILTWAISLFVGAMATARLAGRIDDFAGMLHGFTLWGIATIATVIFGTMGINSMLQTGQHLIASSASGVSMVASGTGSAVSNVASGLGYAADSTYDGATYAASMVSDEFGQEIQTRLTDQAAELAASTDDQLTEQEIKTALNDLDERTLRRLVLDLTNDDQEGAAEMLAEATELSTTDAEALIEAAYEQVQEQLPNMEDVKQTAQILQQRLAQNVDSYVASLDAAGGTDVSERDIRRAVNSLDAQDMREIAMNLTAENPAGVKRVLARQTTLSSDEIDELYEGAMEGIEETAAEYRESLNETIERISTYTQQVLWTVFAGTALALAIALLGGWLGADTSRKVYVVKSNVIH